MKKAGKPLRVFFFNLAGLILIGIGLSGFRQVHWFSYVAPAVLLSATATGVCPGLITMQALFGKKSAA
jgi:fluoride ion exporter CrcB/FEX